MQDPLALANNWVQTYPDGMNQIPAPETEIAFRVSPKLVRGVLRMLLILMIVAAVFGGLALMSVADAPLLNSAGLVFALVLLMLVFTVLYLRRAKNSAATKHFVRGHTSAKHRVKIIEQREALGTRTLVQDLALLAQLHSNGQLTDAEFSSLKSKLMGT